MEATSSEIAPLGLEKKSKSEYELRQTNAWQRKLMPWLIAMPTVLILLFVYLATRQMQRFNTVLDAKSESAIEKLIPSPSDTVLYEKLKGDMAYIRWVTLARMEEKSFDRRYSQGGLLLASRIFTKYLGFFTGMILAIVGSVFIIGKLQEDQSNVEGGMGESMKVKIASSSPGIIFGVLGTILMLSTIMQHTDITTNDQPLFLTQPNVLLNTGMKSEAAPAAEPKEEAVSATALDSLFNNQ